MRRVLAVAACALVALGGTARAQHARRLEFTYTATVSDIPEDAGSVRMWMPYPVSNAYQDVASVRIDAPYPTSIGAEAEYGNSILYIDATGADESFVVTMTVDVTRREQVSGETGGGKVGDELRSRLLQEDALVPITGRIAELDRGDPWGAGVAQGPRHIRPRHEAHDLRQVG